MTRIPTKNQLERSGFRPFQSDSTAVASTISVTTVPQGEKLYVGFNTYTNSDGTTPGNATAGTVDISIKTAVSNQDWEEVASNVSVSDLVTTVIDKGPVTAIRAVPDTAISGGSVTHYRMVILAL